MRDLMASLLNLFRTASAHRDSLPAFAEDPNTPAASPESHEGTLIANILEIRDQPVSELMVPRADIVAVEESTDRGALLELLAGPPTRRLPVYRETLDEVIGIDHIKDVLVAIAENRDFTVPD